MPLNKETNANLFFDSMCKLFDKSADPSVQLSTNMIKYLNKDCVAPVKCEKSQELIVECILL